MNTTTNFKMALFASEVDLGKQRSEHSKSTLKMILSMHR